jgi:DNA polymerase/3'-5' exonuclease PolX
LATGFIAECVGIELPVVDSRLPVTKIHGVGPVIAAKLKEKYNIIFAEELIEQHRANIIPEMLNHDILIGMKYFSEFNQRIPRAEVKQWKQEVRKLFNFKICGSYRRKVETCGDIDVLTTEPIANCVNLLEANGYICRDDILGMGETKFMGVTCTKSVDGVIKHRRLDIRCVKPESMVFALLYYTGSCEFNKMMRSRALSFGLTLNEYGIFKCKSLERVVGAIPTEKDIFSLLFLDFKKPSERNLI